jgi:hypothetical protein
VTAAAFDVSSGGLIGYQNAAGDSFYYTTDRQGSVIHLSDQTGALDAS